MFIDTSVIVATLSNEDDAAALAERIEAAPLRVTSALVFLEATMRLSTKLAIHPLAVEKRIQAFLTEADIGFAPMDEHTAALSMKAFVAYQGEDFSHTDLA